MEISTTNPGFYFTLFYILAFAFMFIMVIRFGLKKGYPLRSVLLLLATITIFTVIGSRLFTIPINEWGNILNTDISVHFNNRSAIGGLLFGLLGLIISQRLYGFNRPILDLYAWIVPIGFGIQKIGCFFNGCCYGKPSELIWSVQYPKGTQAHFSQWAANLIDTDATLSMNVHPVQLYEVLLLFTIGYFVWKTHKIWKKSASALLFSFFLFFSFRFFIEFIRDPSSSQFNVFYLWGVRLFQWIILGFSFAFGLILIWYEKYLKTDIIKGYQKTVNLQMDGCYIIILSILIYVFNGLFSKFELVAVWMKFIPAVLLTLYYLYTNNRVKKYRLATSFLILIPLYIMAQSVQTDSTKVEKYKRLDIGGSFGSFFNEVKYNPQQGECGTSYQSEHYKHVYQVGGVGLSQVVKEGNNYTTYGLNLHAGSTTTSSLTTNEEKSNFIFGANPYIKYDMSWFGIGAGLQLGNIRKNTNEELDESTLKDAHKNHVVLPEFYIRVGRRDILDIDYNYGFLFPSPYPTLNQRFSIGTGFGQKSDYSLRYGIFMPLESKFISAEGLINKNIGLKMMYIFKEPQDYYDIDENAKGKFVVGLNYRFGN